MFGSALEGLTLAVFSFGAGVLLVDLALNARRVTQRHLLNREVEHVLQHPHRPGRRLHTNDHAAA